MNDPFNFNQFITIMVLLSTLVILLIYDFIMFTFIDDQASISQTTYKLVRKAPIIAFLIGLAAGHLFWPIHSLQKPSQNHIQDTINNVKPDKNSQNASAR